MAHYDGLTHLPNRRLFQDRWDEAIAAAQDSGRMVAVICVDLVIQHGAEVCALIEQLQMRGVRVVVDDVGLSTMKAERLRHVQSMRSSSTAVS